LPINLELKIKIDSFESLIEKLKFINAKRDSILLQKDIYYKIPTGLIKLRTESGTKTLIYYNRDEISKNRWSDFNLLKIDDENAEEFLNKLFEIEQVVEKERQLFWFNNTRIHLDKVKELGNFLELETLMIDGKADAEKRFDEMVNLLNLDLSKQIKKSYKNLISEKTNSG
jgi:predicted adenylyl cyclase CyaB